MKPVPTRDFPVTVSTDAEDEDDAIHDGISLLEILDALSTDAEDEDDAIQSIYHGIYDVRLNFTVHLAFVPDLQRGNGPWPPLRPTERQANSPRAARITAVESSSYAVTPDAQRAGQTEVITLPRRSGDPTQKVLFYVTPEAFAQFSAELAPLAAEWSGVHSYRPVSQLQDYTFVQWITTTLLPSPHLKPYHRQLLGLEP